MFVAAPTIIYLSLSLSLSLLPYISTSLIPISCHKTPSFNHHDPQIILIAHSGYTDGTDRLLSVFVQTHSQQSLSHFTTSHAANIDPIPDIKACGGVKLRLQLQLQVQLQLQLQVQLQLQLQLHSRLTAVKHRSMPVIIPRPPQT